MSQALDSMSDAELLDIAVNIKEECELIIETFAHKNLESKAVIQSGLPVGSD